MFSLLLFGGGQLCGQNKADSLHREFQSSNEVSDQWQALYRLGTYYYQTERKLDSAVLYLRQSIDLARTANLPEELGRSFWRLGVVHFETALPSDQFIPFLDTAIVVNQSCDCTQNLMEMLTVRGLVYQGMGRQDAALEYFNECMKIAQANGSTRQMVALYNSMAGSFDEINDPEKVLEYYLKGLAIVDTMDWPLGRSVILNNIADVYLTQEKFAEAESYFLEAIELKRSIDNTTKLSVSLCQVAHLYMETDRWELARVSAAEGLQLARETSYANGITICLSCLATLAGERQDYYRQIQYAKEGLAILSEKGMAINDLGLGYYESIYGAFQSLNMFDSAFYYLEKHQQLSDTMQAIQKTEALQIQETNFKLQEAEYNNQILQEQQAQAESKLRRRQNAIILVAFLALLLLSWALWWNRKKAILNRQLDELVQEKTEALQHSIQNLEKANEELTYFTYITSHDLREPLRNISGFASLLGRKLEMPSGPIRDLLESIKDSTKQMDHLIQDVMQYSMIAKKELVSEIFALGDIIKMVRQDMKLMLLKKNGHIIYDNEITLHTSKTALQLIVGNLCKNAIHYNESLAPTIQISAEKTEAHLLLHFKDNGIGIDTEFQEQIFEMFKRLHSRAEYDGSGLGLAITKRALDQIGGNISVHSAKGKGSTFTVQLPLASMVQQAQPLVQSA
ncbi:MAG: ATP-binding protein [Bacteroidota bacterium]